MGRDHMWTGRGLSSGVQHVGEAAMYGDGGGEVPSRGNYVAVRQFRAFDPEGRHGVTAHWDG
ncbi:hypothetical protein Scel_80270 [Streptomyces cellostaticus]|nr:hypothetical protein Scel_80270 [Streptomyces cellostaticus]